MNAPIAPTAVVPGWELDAAPFHAGELAVQQRVVRAGLHVRRVRVGRLTFGHRLSPVGTPRGSRDGGHARRLR
ncbi:hypothetical protein, partial [Burkholderia sp. Ac-20349]|uniref:hypothetical protein n=1 Tax=Burkholderia sp. Ac-20349 TaxID=2703893 RepID=UPI00197B24B6